MITLPTQVTITTDKNGNDLHNPISFTNVNYSVNINPDNQVVQVFFNQISRRIILWQGSTYPTGDISISQIEGAVISVIGSNPQEYFQSLM
jgi:hypothetical protein